MKITFLGTNGWYDTDCGNTICTLIETKTAYIMLDAGNGIHTLAKFNFKALEIIGQPGTKATINEFLAPNYSIPVDQLPFPCKVIDVKEGWHRNPLKFQALPLVHASKCFGYRFEFDGKVISYCTDTGYCKNSVELSAKADLLISECAFLSGQISDSWPHMNPQLAAKLAMESKAKKLALTHFDAALYTTMAKRDKAQEHAQKIFPKTFSAYDGLRIAV